MKNNLSVEEEIASESSAGGGGGLREGSGLEGASVWVSVVASWRGEAGGSVWLGEEGWVGGKESKKWWL